MNLRSPTSGEVALIGLVMLVSSLSIWTIFIAYEARHEIFEIVVTVGRFVTNFPHGTLTTTAFLGVLLLYIGIMTSLEP